MKVSQSRREFVAHSSQACAALALPSGTSGAFAVAATAAPSAVSPDLLRALGNRIGFEVATAISSDGAALTMSYLDCAGRGTRVRRSPSVTRIGTRRRVDQQCRNRARCTRRNRRHGAQHDRADRIGKNARIDTPTRRAHSERGQFVSRELPVVIGRYSPYEPRKVR